MYANEFRMIYTISTINLYAVSIESRVAQISLWHFRGLDYEGEGDTRSTF